VPEVPEGSGVVLKSYSELVGTTSLSACSGQSIPPQPSSLSRFRFFAYWSKSSCLFSTSNHFSLERAVPFGSFLSFSAGSVQPAQGCSGNGSGFSLTSLSSPRRTVPETLVLSKAPSHHRQRHCSQTAPVSEVGRSSIGKSSPDFPLLGVSKVRLFLFDILKLLP
jgi:hypothetical protein